MAFDHAFKSHSYMDIVMKLAKAAGKVSYTKDGIVQKFCDDANQNLIA